MAAAESPTSTLLADVFGEVFYDSTVHGPAPANLDLQQTQGFDEKSSPLSDNLDESITSVMDDYTAWIACAFFLVLQLSTLAITGDSFFGIMTGGVVESLHLATGVEMTWHMLFGSSMWFLAFVQIFCSRLRKGNLAWIHRLSGRLLLPMWFLVVGPTAAYLSLLVGVGKARAQVIMMGFALAGMDTTLFATYYMWRAFVIAWRQKRGRLSLGLHGRAMKLGMMCTMLILFQRSVQFTVIVGRKVVLAMLTFTCGGASAPFVWSWLSSFLDLACDHNVILSLTTLVPSGLLLLLVDGPRSRIGYHILQLQTKEEQEEFFGSLQPSKAELFFWRLRVPVYILLRMLVTNGWTLDPAQFKGT